MKRVVLYHEPASARLKAVAARPLGQPRTAVKLDKIVAVNSLRIVRYVDPPFADLRLSAELVGAEIPTVQNQAHPCRRRNISDARGNARGGKRRSRADKRAIGEICEQNPVFRRAPLDPEQIHLAVEFQPV